MNIHPSLDAFAVDIDSLEPLPDNPRRGDVDAIARSYAAFGQRKPVVARRDGSSLVVVAGNHQLAAAKQLGWKKIAAIFVDDDDETAAAFALADNRTAELGTYDEDELLALIKSIDDPYLLEATGYDADAIDRLVHGDEFEPVLEDTQPRLDQASPIICPECGHEFVPNR